MDVGRWLRGLGLEPIRGRVSRQRDRGGGPSAPDGRGLEGDWRCDGRRPAHAARRDRRIGASNVFRATGRSLVRHYPQKTPEVSAERRPITVMFCDLVGSTSSRRELDAEDWRNLVNAYLDEASAAVTGLGGHVLKRLGDGLMALFGYPQAQENDAERAVRAALAIQRALADINARNAAKACPSCLARVGLEFWACRRRGDGRGVR